MISQQTRLRGLYLRSVARVGCVRCDNTPPVVGKIVIAFGKFENAKNSCDKDGSVQNEVLVMTI